MGQRYSDGTGTLDFTLLKEKIESLEFLWIPATDFVASAAGPALEVVDVIHHGFLLDGSSSEAVSRGLWIPQDWETVGITYVGYNATSGSGGVALAYFMEPLAAGVSLTAATPTIADPTIFTAGAEDTLQIIEGSTDIEVLGGGYNALKVGRLPGDDGDTLAADYGLLGVVLTRTS